MNTVEDPAPPITEEIAVWRTRSHFRSDVRDALLRSFQSSAVTVQGGEMDGIHVVTRKALLEALDNLLSAPLPPVSTRHAEVLTDAIITVWASCPLCHIANPITLSVGPELRVDNGSAELHLKAKAKARTHVCGQLTVPEPTPVGQTTTWPEDDPDSEDVPASEPVPAAEFLQIGAGDIIEGEARRLDDGTCGVVTSYDAKADRETYCDLPAGHDGGIHDDDGSPVPRTQSPAVDAISEIVQAKASGEYDDDLLPGEPTAKGRDWSKRGRK